MLLKPAAPCSMPAKPGCHDGGRLHHIATPAHPHNPGPRCQPRHNLLCACGPHFACLGPSAAVYPGCQVKGPATCIFSPMLRVCSHSDALPSTGKPSGFGNRGCLHRLGKALKEPWSRRQTKGPATCGVRAGTLKNTERVCIAWCQGRHLEGALVQAPGQGPQVLQQGALVREGEVEAQVAGVLPEEGLAQELPHAALVHARLPPALPQNLRACLSAAACPPNKTS